MQKGTLVNVRNWILRLPVDECSLFCSTFVLNTSGVRYEMVQEPMMYLHAENNLSMTF